MAKYASGRLLSLQIEGTDQSDAFSAAVIESAEGDSDFLSFAKARSGGNQDFVFKATVAQDFTAGSPYRECWDNRGDEVPILIAPYGNAAASAAEPHVSATAIISLPDGTLVGGESTVSTSSAFTVEVTWKLTGEPTLVTA